jgi:hypothetical protein
VVGDNVTLDSDSLVNSDVTMDSDTHDEQWRHTDSDVTIDKAAIDRDVLYSGQLCKGGLWCHN